MTKTIKGKLNGRTVYFISGDKDNNMEQQYYTPEIGDFREGYMYEKYIAGSNTEYEEKLFTLRDPFIVNCYNEKCEEGWIRVPYLTKEQIENEGWKCIDEKNNWYKKEDNILIRSTISHKVQISNISYHWASVEFDGYCPSINEFRYICKLLKIK